VTVEEQSALREELQDALLEASDSKVARETAEACLRACKRQHAEEKSRMERTQAMALNRSSLFEEDKDRFHASLIEVEERRMDEKEAHEEVPRHRRGPFHLFLILTLLTLIQGHHRYGVSPLRFGTRSQRPYRSPGNGARGHQKLPHLQAGSGDQGGRRGQGGGEAVKGE